MRVLIPPPLETFISFHSHLGQHMFGFPFRLRSWPYQPSGGRATMTPLILGSICLIGSERIRAYHDLLPRLVASSLRESIMDVEPGNSFAPLPEGYQIAGQNQPEPDLDLELGIGAPRFIFLEVLGEPSLTEGRLRSGGDQRAAYLRDVELLSAVGHHRADGL